MDLVVFFFSPCFYLINIFNEEENVYHIANVNMIHENIEFIAFCASIGHKIYLIQLLLDEANKL